MMENLTLKVMILILDGLDPETQAVRIGARVGNRKRLDIHDRANSLGLRILNQRRIERKGDL